MIITKVRLQEEHPMAGASATYPLPIFDFHVDSSAGDNGYLLKAAAGIDPPDFNAIVTGFDTNGVPVKDSEPAKREIALKIGFKTSAGVTVAGLRSKLYRLASRSLLIKFMDEANVVAQARGYIQNLDASHFSSSPEILINIQCDSGDLYSPNSIAIPLATLDVASPVINYQEGDAPTGLDLVFKATGNVSGFSISNYGKLWYEGSGISNTFAVVYSFINNDQITISTHPSKSKRITLRRSSVDYDIGGYITGSPIWPKLFPGVNTFDWNIRTANTFQWLSASYIPRYWGV